MYSFNCSISGFSSTFLSAFHIILYIFNMQCISSTVYLLLTFMFQFIFSCSFCTFIFFLHFVFWFLFAFYLLHLTETHLTHTHSFLLFYFGRSNHFYFHSFAIAAFLSFCNCYCCCYIFFMVFAVPSSSSFAMYVTESMQTKLVFDLSNERRYVFQKLKFLHLVIAQCYWAIFLREIIGKISFDKNW